MQFDSNILAVAVAGGPAQRAVFPPAKVHKSTGRQTLGEVVQCEQLALTCRT